MITVELFTKGDCSLCDSARAAIDAARGEVPFELVVRDITQDPALFERYRYDIPVVHVDGHRAFKHRLEASELVARVRRAEAGR